MAKRICQQHKTTGRFRTNASTEKSPEQLPPLFSLQDLQSSHCISRCEQQEKAHFADTLRKLSQFTWADLKQKGRHKLGFEKINRSSLKVPIPRNIKDDAKFIAFRFDGKKAMIGYRNGRIFNIIWLDRDFSAYKHS